MIATQTDVLARCHGLVGRMSYPGRLTVFAVGDRDIGWSATTQTTDVADGTPRPLTFSKLVPVAYLAILSDRQIVCHVLEEIILGLVAHEAKERFMFDGLVFDDPHAAPRAWEAPIVQRAQPAPGRTG